MTRFRCVDDVLYARRENMPKSKFLQMLDAMTRHRGAVHKEKVPKKKKKSVKKQPVGRPKKAAKPKRKTPVHANVRSALDNLEMLSRLVAAKRPRRR